MAGVLVTREWVRKVERRLKRAGADRQPRAQRRPKTIADGIAGFNAKVTELGPAAEADFTDQRYWVAWATATNTDADEAETLEFSGEEIAGVLGTRTDATSGQLTGLPEGHGLTAGQCVDLTWTVAPAGRRRWVLIGVVGATTAYFSAGSGDDLPAAASAMTVVVIEIVMATNRSEDVSLTHYAREGQGVQVWAEADATDPAVVRYFFAFLPWLLAFFVGSYASSAGAQHVWEAAPYWYNSHYGWLGKTAPRPYDGGGLMKFAVWNGELYGVGLGWTHWVGPNPGDTVTWYVIKWDRAIQAWIKWDGSGGSAHTLGDVRDIVVWSNRLWIIGDVTTGDAHKAIWSWDGTLSGVEPVWTADLLPGSIPIVGYCLCVYANKLYAGIMVQINGEVGGVYRKETAGGAWLLVGNGLSRTSSYPQVHALAVHDGKLIAGGVFNKANGTVLAVANIATWNDTTWAALGSGLPPTDGSAIVRALASFEDDDALPAGSGPHLYAGGQGFTTFGNLARWNGTTWAALPNALTVITGTATVYALTVYRGQLVVGGRYHFRGPVYGTVSMTGSLMVRAGDYAGTVRLRQGHGIVAGDNIDLVWTAGGGGHRWTNEVDTIDDQTLTDTTGVLTTRTNDTDGVITLTAGHPFRTGDIVQLDWTTGAGGHRYGVQVNIAGATTIEFSGGSGTLLRNPGTGEEIDVSVDVSDIAFSGDAGGGDVLPAQNTDLTVSNSGGGTTVTSPYETCLSFYANGVFRHAGGGFGQNPVVGGGGGGEVVGLSVVQYDEFGPVPTMFIGGEEPSNQLASSYAAALTARGYRPLQGGLSGNYASWPGGVRASLRWGNKGAAILGGSFTEGRNENIAETEAGKVLELTPCRGVARWTGRYIESVGQVSTSGGRGLDKVILATTFYNNLPVVAGAQLAPRRLAIGSGPLMTRTSDKAGVVTLGEPHGFGISAETSSAIDLFWTGGRRARAVVSGVSGGAVTFSGGTGDDLPIVGTPIEATGDFIRLFPDQTGNGDFELLETNSINGLCAVGNDLYMLLETALGTNVFLWNGSTLSNVSPPPLYNWNFGKAGMVANLDRYDRPHICGTAGGQVVLYRARGAWRSVGVNVISGEARSLARVDYGGSIGMRLYACGALTVDTVACTVAELRYSGGVWTWYRIAAAVITGGSAFAVSGPQGTWERPHLTLVGDQYELHDVGANVDLIVNGVAEYHPTTGWRAQNYGGLNSRGLSLGGVLGPPLEAYVEPYYDGGFAPPETPGITLDGGYAGSAQTGITADGGGA